MLSDSPAPHNQRRASHATQEKYFSKAAAGGEGQARGLMVQVFFLYNVHWIERVNLSAARVSECFPNRSMRLANNQVEPLSSLVFALNLCS